LKRGLLARVCRGSTEPQWRAKTASRPPGMEGCSEDIPVKCVQVVGWLACKRA
jgi:hypothetical protein